MNEYQRIAKYYKGLVKKGFECGAILQCLEYKFPHSFELRGESVWITGLLSSYKVC